MPPRGSLIFHLTCLIYVPYLGKLKDRKITVMRLMEHLSDIIKVNFTLVVNFFSLVVSVLNIYVYSPLR